LAICRELVALMGGVIRAESTPGVGTRVTVRLELALAEAEALDASSRAASMAGARFARCGSEPLVLVADDHPLNRRIIGLLLDELGLAHKIVEDGAAAVDAAASPPPPGVGRVDPRPSLYPAGQATHDAVCAQPMPDEGARGAYDVVERYAE
jgi:hypothetical protein